jgi:hypothetical protein
MMHHGLSVVLARRECIQTASRNKKAEVSGKNKTKE